MLNTEEFLGMTSSEATSTRVVLINPGEYPATIAPGGIALADFMYKKGEREGETGYRMTVKWELEDFDGALEKELSRKPTITQSIMLDLNSNGGLDMGKGKNVGLGRLREAVGQNEDGKPWQPAMLIGQQALIQVSHRIDDKGETQQEVKSVTKLVR